MPAENRQFAPRTLCQTAQIRRLLPAAGRRIIAGTVATFSSPRTPRRLAMKPSRRKLSRRKLAHPGIALVLLALAGATIAFAQAPPLMTPGPEHKEMAREVGVWDAEVSLYPTPDAPAVTSKGTETNEMLGKFWLVSEFTGELMGEKFIGRGQMTYDSVKKKYYGTWIDSVSSNMLTTIGDYDAKTHTLTLMMEGIDGMTGQPGKWKSSTHYVDADTKTFEMQAPVEGQDGKWWKMMEAKYKKRK
jgi:hypothetical protein